MTGMARGFAAPMGAVDGVAPVALTWERARIGIPAVYTGSGVVLGRLWTARKR